MIDVDWAMAKSAWERWNEVPDAIPVPQWLSENSIRFPVEEKPWSPIGEFCKGVPVAVCGMVTMWYGDGESRKTTAAAVLAAKHLMGGGLVVWYVEQSPMSLQARLRTCGASDPAICTNLYVVPTSTVVGKPADVVDAGDGETRDWLDGALVIIDTVAAWGGATMDAAQYREWFNKQAHGWTSHNAAVILIDHMPKQSGDDPEKSAWGSVDKRNSLDLQYRFERFDNFSKIFLAKDREGILLPKQTGQHVANIGYDDGRPVFGSPEDLTEDASGMGIADKILLELESGPAGSMSALWESLGVIGGPMRDEYRNELRKLEKEGRIELKQSGKAKTVALAEGMENQ